MKILMTIFTIILASCASMNYDRDIASAGLQIQATVINSTEKQKVWDSMRRTRYLGNSANASYVRAHEAFENFGIKSNKIFLYFSPLFQALVSPSTHFHKGSFSNLREYLKNRKKII